MEHPTKIRDGGEGTRVLRTGVKNGGCSGVSYPMEFEDQMHGCVDVDPATFFVFAQNVLLWSLKQHARKPQFPNYRGRKAAAAKQCSTINAGACAAPRLTTLAADPPQLPNV